FAQDFQITIESTPAHEYLRLAQLARCALVNQPCEQGRFPDPVVAPHDHDRLFVAFQHLAESAKLGLSIYERRKNVSHFLPSESPCCSTPLMSPWISASVNFLPPRKSTFRSDVCAPCMPVTLPLTFRPFAPILLPT